MSTTEFVRPGHPGGLVDRIPARRALIVGSVPYLMSAALGLAAAASGGLSLFFPDLLAGSPITVGSLRGTALVILVAGLPVLAIAMARTRRGSSRGLVVWLGALGYLLYQAVMFCFATPLNSLFLLYVAYLGLAVWTIVLVLRATDLPGFAARLMQAFPVRSVAGFALVVAMLNASAWLAKILPTVGSSDPTTVLGDTGLLTNPVFVQDLAVWLPLLTVAAVAAWRREAWGILVTGAMLAMFVLESVSIATDQWFGSRAAPLSSSASMSMVPAFAGVALVTGLVLVVFCRHLDAVATPRLLTPDLQSASRGNNP